MRRRKPRHLSKKKTTESFSILHLGLGNVLRREISPFSLDALVVSALSSLLILPISSRLTMDAFSSPPVKASRLARKRKKPRTIDSDEDDFEPMNASKEGNMPKVHNRLSKGKPPATATPKAASQDSEDFSPPPSAKRKHSRARVDSDDEQERPVVMAGKVSRRSGLRGGPKAEDEEDAFSREMALAVELSKKEAQSQEASKPQAERKISGGGSESPPTLVLDPVSMGEEELPQATSTPFPEEPKSQETDPPKTNLVGKEDEQPEDPEQLEPAVQAPKSDNLKAKAKATPVFKPPAAKATSSAPAKPKIGPASKTSHLRQQEKVRPPTPRPEAKKCARKWVAPRFMGQMGKGANTPNCDQTGGKQISHSPRLGLSRLQALKPLHANYKVPDSI